MSRQSFPPVLLLGEFLLLLVASAILFSCKPPVTSRMTPEEAGYYNEIKLAGEAACKVGTFYNHRVGTRSQICWGNAYNGCYYGRKSVPIYERRMITQLQGYADGLPADWKEQKAKVQVLLPPPGYEALHDGIINALSAQIALAEQSTTDSGSDETVIDPAKTACSSYNSFLSIVSARPPSAESPAPLAISFRPIGTPLSFGVTTKGEFSVTVSDSIDTPIGSFSVSQAVVQASQAQPKKLIIRSGGRERRLLLDRPFTLFVPASYGVQLANSETELVLQVLDQPDASNTTPPTGS